MSWTRTLALACALTLTSALGLTGCASSTGGTQGATFVGGDQTITLIAPARRGQPVALAGTTVAGSRLDLASYRGKTVVLNVWGSWCAPCRLEAPALQSAYGELRGQGVEFVGIDFQEPSPDTALAYQTTFGVTYPSLVDDGGELLLALRGAVAAKAIPSTLVLDPQGRIAARVTGPTTKVTLVNLVQDVQSGKTSP